MKIIFHFSTISLTDHQVHVGSFFFSSDNFGCLKFSSAKLLLLSITSWISLLPFFTQSDKSSLPVSPGEQETENLSCAPNYLLPF